MKSIIKHYKTVQMLNIKNLSLICFLVLLQTAIYGQKNNFSDAWVLDSSKVSSPKLPQHTDFVNNTYPYPPKPRTKMEFGAALGLAQIYGDVAQRAGYGGSISFRKAFGHVISLRAAYFGSINYGTDGELRNPYLVNAPGTPNPWAVYGSSPFSSNYRTKLHQLALDAIISLNGLAGYSGNPSTDWYLLVGYSFQGADVDVNALDANNHPYTFANNTAINYTGTTTSIQKDITTYEDASYESNAPVQVSPNKDFVRRAIKDNWLLNNGLNFGGGVSFRVNKDLNIGIEQRFTITGNDNLDGIVSGNSADIQSNTQVRFNFNIGNPNKRLEPLWWLNGDNYIYNEVNAPKHMKMPPVILPDADGDGVTDRFDLEPNTPKGCKVDSHGVSLDTDGDGVPDCTDKELLTPQKCFPVDADGVGKCPEPDCCDSFHMMATNMGPINPSACSLASLGTINFKSGSLELSKEATTLLNKAVVQINAHPACKLKVTGYGERPKPTQQVSYDQVNGVVNYLVGKGISLDRIIFSYGEQGGTTNTVSLGGTVETQPGK